MQRRAAGKLLPLQFTSQHGFFSPGFHSVPSSAVWPQTCPEESTQVTVTSEARVLFASTEPSAGRGVVEENDDDAVRELLNKRP